MFRMHKTIALMGAAAASSILNGFEPVRYEVSGWSRPGPKYRAGRNNSIATGPHLHLREIARRRRQYTAALVRHATSGTTIPQLWKNAA